MKPDEGLIEVLRTQVRFAHLSPQAQTTRGMGEAGGLTRWGQRVVVAAIPHVHDLLVDKNFDGTPKEKKSFFIHVKEFFKEIKEDKNKR